MHAFSRGHFLRRSAATAGGLAGLGLLESAPAFARAAGEPNPIPGGFDETFTPVASDPFIHTFSPGIGFEMSSITDFKGVVGGSEIRGTARGSDGTTYGFDTDMRFMQGTYVDVSGKVRQGTFGFI